MVTTETLDGECDRCGATGPVIRLRLGAISVIVDACKLCSALLGRIIENALLRMPPSLHNAMPQDSISEVHNAIIALNDYSGSPQKGN